MMAIHMTFEGGAKIRGRRLVFEHLEPFLACFEHITFRLAFQSSLPSATKFFFLQLLC